MLIRIVYLAALGLGLWFLWRRLRPHPLKSVPMRWRLLAANAPMMREALRIRASMVRMVLRGHAQAASGLIGDVDRLVESIAQAVELRNEARALPSTEGPAKEATAQIKGALHQLEQAHVHLLDTARAELDVAIRDVRGQLGDHTEQLRRQVEAQREVDRMLEEDDPT